MNIISSNVVGPDAKEINFDYKYQFELSGDLVWIGEWTLQW